jgi:hypothetical protein
MQVRTQTSVATPVALSPTLSPAREKQYQQQLRESNQLVERFLKTQGQEADLDEIKSLRRECKRIYGRLSKSQLAPFFLARLEAIEYIWELLEETLQSCESLSGGLFLEVEEEWLSELEHLIG